MSENKDAAKADFKEPTPEELKKRKQELMAFYKGELSLLRLHSEYEELLTKIDVAKMTRIEIMMARAQMMEGPQSEGPQQGPSQGPPKEPQPKEFIRPMNQEEPKPEKKGKRKLKAEK